MILQSLRINIARTMFTGESKIILDYFNYNILYFWISCYYIYVIFILITFQWYSNFPQSRSLISIYDQWACKHVSLRIMLFLYYIRNDAKRKAKPKETLTLSSYTYDFKPQFYQFEKAIICIAWYLRQVTIKETPSNLNGPLLYPSDSFYETNNVIQMVFGTHIHTRYCSCRNMYVLSLLVLVNVLYVPETPQCVQTLQDHHRCFTIVE